MYKIMYHIHLQIIKIYTLEFQKRLVQLYQLEE